jgi:hypothetical protein
MNTEHGKIEGDVEITSGLKLHGMITGSAIVKKGGVLILHGTVTKNVIVEDGAVVEISGMVSGDVINRGGNLQITGTVVGRLFEVSGTTQVSPNAAIGTGNA